MNSITANHNKKERRNSLFLFSFLTVMIAAVFLVSFLLVSFAGAYRETTMRESVHHLMELENQIVFYIEEYISKDRVALGAIAENIGKNKFGSDNLLEYITSRTKTWQASGIVLYAADGGYLQTGNMLLYNDDISNLLVRVERNGDDISITQSTYTYTIPVDTKETINGSKIVAVSIVRELSGFIDSMGFSSFGGEGNLVLTQNNGAIISQLTHKNAVIAYNIQAAYEGYTLVNLDESTQTKESILYSDKAGVFLLQKGTDRRYIAYSPVKASENLTMRLYYFVPESAVNKSLYGFSSRVLASSITIIAIFAAFSVIAFIGLYSMRKKVFDKEINIRDTMFNLLVKNTNNAFALLSIGEELPVYQSSNTKSVIGFDNVGLHKNEHGYCLQITDGSQPDELLEINRELLLWDGKSEFRSGYLPVMKDGVGRYFSMSLYPTIDDESIFVGVASDVTQEREREEALKDAIAMANSANAAKTRFLANMSHDIRTPMNAIINMTDFAFESVNDKKALLECLTTIRDSSAHLLRLINDVLDMSRIESGETVIAAVQFDIFECITGACEVIQPLCEAKKHNFSMNFAGVHSRHLIGDKLKVTQILINLLNNAVKFTPERGRIVFTVDEELSLRSETAVMRFTVADNGIGISPEDKARIFEAFVRSDNLSVNSTEGSGLGLSICRSYINAMGGTIHCESETGAGSVFTVEISFPKVMEKNIEEVEEVNKITDFTGKRALLCEDNDVNRTIAKRILSKMGFAVETAADGSIGADMFIKSENGYYDLIYMDIQMPVMNGYEAAEVIRSSAHPRAHTIPIIAMTANVFAEDVERARAAGMNGHIGKPLIIRDLVRATERAFLQAGDEE